jgi:acid stress chaperone HdeB
MLFLKPFLLGSIVAVLAFSAAQAQVTIDVSKITCDQYLLNKVASPKTVGVWLSGFYAGKRNNTVVDTTTLEINAEKVSEYCGSNRNMTLMQAVETALGK